MHKRSTPNPRRRSILKLMAGSVAGAGLHGIGAKFARAAEARTKVSDTIIALEFDSSLRSRVIAQQGSVPLTDFEPSETVWVEGKHIDDFAFVDTRSQGVQDVHGEGTLHLLRGRSTGQIEKQISISLYDRFPGFAIMRVAYRNGGRQTVKLDGWMNGAHVLKPAVDGALDYWSFSGASYVDRRDWVQPLHAGFVQRNFMGMNATDYGGGTPVVDVWRRDYGLATAMWKRCRSS
jgi:alpha-galactosidase